MEYDLPRCSFQSGVVVLGNRCRVEQSAVPRAMVWHPDTEAESFLLMVRMCFALGMPADRRRPTTRPSSSCTTQPPRCAAARCWARRTGSPSTTC